MDLGKIKGVKFNSSSAFNNKNKKQDTCSEINSPQAKYNTPSNPSYWQAFGNISPATEQKLISNEEFDFIFKPLKNTSENYIPDYVPFVEQTAVEVSKSSPQSLKNFVSILTKNQEYLHFNPIIKPSVFLAKDFSTKLPYCEDFIDEIFQRLVAAGDTDSMRFVAPFASEDVIDEYFKTGNAPASLFPFVSKDALDEGAWKKYREEGVRAIAGYRPFMTEDSLQKIAEEEYQKNSDLNAVLPLAPFLSEDYLGTLAVKAVEKDGIKAIVPIAPFINTDVLEKYIREKYL